LSQPNQVREEIDSAQTAIKIEYLLVDIGKFQKTENRADGFAINAQSLDLFEWS